MVGKTVDVRVTGRHIRLWVGRNPIYRWECSVIDLKTGALGSGTAISEADARQQAMQCVREEAAGNYMIVWKDTPTERAG